MAKDDPDIWFEPKRYGLGAGMPVAWQGWVLLVGYLVLLGMDTRWLAARHAALFAGLATVAFVALAAQHTRGGLRWRWGKEDE